jgi:hypothetical protein
MIKINKHRLKFISHNMKVINNRRLNNIQFKFKDKDKRKDKYKK